jgi:hypothetical protein
MLDEWALAYARTLRPKLVIGRYRAANFTEWRLWQLEKHQALWGGEPAGALLTDYLRPGGLTIYAKQVPGRMVVEYKLTAVTDRQATDGLVEFRTKFWEFDVPGNTRGIVPPALVYADLLATGDARCIETARKVYDGNLAQLFPEG